MAKNIFPVHDQLIFPGKSAWFPGNIEKKLKI